MLIAVPNNKSNACWITWAIRRYRLLTGCIFIHISSLKWNLRLFKYQLMHNSIAVQVGSVQQLKLKCGCWKIMYATQKVPQFALMAALSADWC